MLNFSSEQEYIEHLYMLLKTAIKDRIDTIHPFSAHMSGGLDSTPLAIMSRRILKKKNIPFYTFNWCKPRVEDKNLHKHEWSDARDIAKAESFIHYKIEFNANSMKNDLDNHNIAICGTAMFEYENILIKQAQQLGIRGILSGFGEDEILTIKSKDNHFKKVRKGKFIDVYRLLFEEAAIHKRSKIRILYRLLKLSVKSFIPKKLIHKNFLETQLKKRYYINKIFPQDTKEFIATDVNSYMPESIKEKQLSLIESGYHQERLESWAAIGKKAGINYLYTLLDKRIVEFALSLPGELYYKDGTNRYLYRKVVEHFLPKFLHTKLKVPEIYRVTHLLKARKDALKKLDYERVLKQVNLLYINEEVVFKILKEIDIESDDKILNIEKAQSLSSVYFALMLKQRYS